MPKRQAKPQSPLRKIHNAVKAMDPLRGPNLLRHSAQRIQDNGDGTLTVKRRLPYARNQPL
jgi:hypothetical protein